MGTARKRAVVVSLRGDRLLAIRRKKRGRRYAVLPGGCVEANEGAREAALRELHEETGLSGVALRHLWTLAHDDRMADYFLIEVPVSPMVMSGPEEQRQSSENIYEPCWIAIADLDSENLQPDMLRTLVRQLARPPQADRQLTAEGDRGLLPERSAEDVEKAAALGRIPCESAWQAPQEVGHRADHNPASSPV